MARRANAVDRGNGGDRDSAKEQSAAPAKSGARHRPLDSELAIIGRLMRLYALLDPVARSRVHDYITVRLNSLPVLAAVGGGTEEEAGADLFRRDGADRAESLSA